MATCPVFTDKTVKNQFNKIVSQFGGEKLSEEEFAFRGVRNARSGIDALAMNVAYFLWDAYNGDFDRIQESAVYKYASTITYVLLGNTTANKAIKNFRDSIEGLTSKEYSEINSFFGKFYKVLSNISIGKNTIDIMQMQEVADSLAHIIVGQSIQSNRPIKEVAAEVLGKFAQSLRNKYISYAEKLGVKTELHLYDEFEKIETGLTKEEYNTGVEEELESVLLRMGDKYSSVIGEFKALLLSDDINPDSAEFKELHKAYKEHISDRITVNSLLKEVNSVRVALGDRLTALKLNDLYKKQIKKYKGALEKLLSGDGKLKRKLEQGDITAAYLVEVLAPMFNNLKLLESLTSFAVYKYANFSGLDYNTDTEFGIFSISSLAQELDDVNKVDTEDGQLDLGYSDEVLDYDKSSFEKGAPISKITKQFFIGLPIGNEAVNILGMKMFIDPAAAAAVVRSILRNSTGNLNDMIGRLQKFQDKYSWLSVLIDRLEKAPAQAKEAFRNNMNAVYVNQYMVFFDLKGNTSVVYRANDASAINSLYDNWVSNLEKSNIADENGYVNLEQLAKNLEVISGKVTKNWNDSVIDELHDFFNSIGIEISRDTLTSKSTDKDNQLFARKLLKELSYKIDRLKKNNNEAKALFSDFYEVYKGKVFRALASLEIRNNPSLMPLSHKVGKKTLYSYTWHSFLSVLNSKLNSDENLVNKLLEAPYRQNSPWLRLIKDKLNKREELSEYVPVINISAFTNQVVKRFGGNENEDLKVGELHESERELLITSLMLKPVVDEITGEERIIFSMPITSDKGTYYTIEAPKFSNILEVNSSGSVVISEQAIEDLIDYAVMPEVERMNKLIQMELRGEEIPEEYRIGGHLFHLVPKLNLQKELFDKDGYIIEDENKIREIAKAVLIREIEHEVSERVRRYKTFNIKATFDNVTIESAFGKEVADAARKNEEALLKAVARYVTMQSRLGYSAIYTTFLPDIATTYKDKYFKEAISHVVEKLSNEVPNFNKDDYTQLQLMRMVSKEDLTFAITAIRNNYNKRAAMFIASGRMGENSGTVNYLVANDRKVASKMVEQLKVILGEKYADYTEKGQLKESTNAQEFITLREYIRNLYFDGQISEDLFTTVMDFFETNSGENYREDYEQDLYKALEEKGVLEEYNNLIVNPMKPVYNWLQTDDITGIKPIYVKSSAYPLLPSMKSLEINKVRALLERNGFDRLTFPSAVKLGVPPKPIELWDKDGNIREDFTPDELEPAALRVDRIGLRIQQDVPFHGLKYVINKSTQAEKNLFTDLLNIRKIVYKGKEYNGKDLHTHYLMLQEKLYGLLTDRLCEDLGIEGFKQWNSRQQQVSELFESNPELANAVYEALGFGQEVDLSTFTNHSGGALGSDTQWDIIGKMFGMVNNKHYYFEGYKTPNGNTAIPINLKNEADEKLKAANKTLGRRFPTSNEYVNNLLRRNWWQVKNSDAIFAISSITDNKVDGGTGWAVHMAIAENKPVYVFDQNKNKWFTWNNNKFVEVDTPVLTKNFAGIGTRKINENGKQAIRDVYEKTTSSQITPEQKQQAQQLYSEYLSQNPNGSIEGFKNWIKNNQSNIQYQKQIDLQAEQDAVLEEFANSLSERFNISFDLISEEDARAMFPKYTNEPAFFDPKTKKAYLVKGKANKTSAIHEIFTHPFLLQIEKTNPTLYKNLLKEAKNNKSVVDYVDNFYGTSQNNDHEYIVRAIDLAVQGELDQQKDKTLLERIQEFFNQLSDYLKKLFNIPKVFSSAISPNITLQQLAQFAMYGKGKMNLNPAQENIEYSLKATDVIVKNLDKIKQWEKNKSVSEDVLWNKIQGLGVPKEQLELVKNSEGNTVEEKLLNFVNQYSFTIEIKTAETITEEDNINFYIKDDYYSLEDNLYWKNDEVINREEYLEALKQYKGVKPTQYYSYLTVPGGTNYTENEICTPLIIPSIRGHADFSTANGIGWFRSDEAIVPGSEGKYQSDGAGGLVKTSISQKTIRRILEIQSDLFQKGRDKEDLAVAILSKIVDTAGIFQNEEYSFTLNGDVYESRVEMVYSEEENQSEPVERYYVNGQRIGFAEIEAAKKEYLASTGQNLPSQNQFLQLLNKNNNWVTFFIKSIIQDSAKKGYEKVLFPTGNTASKVEGHTTLEEFKKQKEDRIKELEKQKATDFYQETEGRFAGMWLGKDKPYKDKRLAEASFDYEINQLKQELERIEREGFGALRPIWNFYENTITNILKKQGYNPVLITDEYGNTWNEVTIDKNRDNQNIVFQKTPKESTSKPDRFHTTDLGTTVERNGNNVVTSINKEKLRDLLVEEGKKRGFSPVELAIISDLDYLSLLPLTPSASIKTEALFNALVKNRIIKIKYPGNSYVLSTEEGFQTKKTATLEEIDKDEVYYTDSFTGELDPGSYVDADGNVLTGKALEEAFKNGTAIVKRPSQVLIPWRFVINGKSVGVESFLKEENGKKMIDMSRVDPEILKMIGLRIPNAGLNSMAAIEIVGFLPEKYGDLVVASRDFLAQMGSDFDVDKLYSYGNTVFVTSDEEGNPKLVKLTEETKDLYINELSEVRNYLTQLKKSRDSEEGPAMTSFMSLFINDLSEVNDLFKEIDIRIVQNEITDIFKTILTTPNRIIALKNLTPTSYGKFSDIAAQAAKEQVNPAIGLYSLISDEYHRRTIEKVNMGKELISIYAAFNPQLSMFQHTKFSVGTVSDESILLSLPDELLGVYEGVFTLDADNKVYLVPKLDGYITTGEMYNSLTLEAQDKLRAAVAKKIGFNKYSEQVTEYISINFEAALDLLDKEDIVFRSDILNGQLQGAVDNAKEDILGTLNINLDNVNNAIALTLLGYSEDVIGHFFRIPVVKQVFDYIKESSSALLENKDYSKSTVTAAVKTVINELIQTYGVKEVTNAFEQLLKRPDVKQKSSGNRSFIHLSNLSVDTMKALINKGQNSTTNQWMDKEDLSNSLNALLQLCVINQMAQTATSVSNALRYDTKELGVSQLDLLNNIKQFYDVYANEKYPAFKETPFIQVSAARHGFYALRVLYYSFYQSKFDPIEFLGSLMNYSYWNKKGLLVYNETTLNYITNATLALVGNRLIQQYYPEFTTEDKLVSNLDVLTKLGALSGQYSVIQKTKKLKGAFPENFFLSSLISVKLTDNAYGLKIKRITHNLEKEVVNGILELYNHDEVIPEIGMSGKDFIRDVAILAMIQGDQAMFNNIFKFIMPSILEDIGVTKVLESLNGENTTLSATEKVSIANQLVQRVPKLAHSPNLYNFKNANKEEASNGYTHTAYVSGDYDLKPGRIIQHTVQQTVKKGGETKIKDVTKLFFIQDYNQDTGFLGLVEIDRIYDNKDNTLIDPALLYVGNKMIKPKPANPWYGTAAYDLSPIRGQRVYTNPLSNLDYVNKKITQLATQTSSQQEDVALESSDSSVKEVIMETPLTRVVQFLSAYTNANFELTEYLKVLSYIEEFNNTEFILNLMNQISLTRGSYQYSDRSVKIMYNRTKTALERQRVLNSILGTFTHELRHKEGHLLILVAKKYDSVNESESFLAAKAYELLQFKHQLFEGYRDVIGFLVGNRLLQQYIELMDKYFKIENDVNSTKEQKDEVSREVNKFAEDNHINSRLWDMLYSAYSFHEFEANLMVKKEVTEIVQMLINEKYNTEETNPYLSFAENPQQAFKSLNSGIVYAYTKKYGKDLGIFSMLYMTKLGLNIIAKAEKMGIFADASVESFDAIASSGTLNYEIYGTPTENRIPTPDEIRKQFGELTKDGKPKLLAVDTNGSSKNYLIMQQRAIRINKGQPYYDVRVVKTHGEGTLRSKEFYTLAFFPRTRVTQELVDSISQEEIEERKKFCGY